jgi:hypothetical protein
MRTLALAVALLSQGLPVQAQNSGSRLQVVIGEMGEHPIQTSEIHAPRRYKYGGHRIGGRPSSEELKKQLIAALLKDGHYEIVQGAPAGPYLRVQGYFGGNFLETVKDNAVLGLFPTNMGKTFDTFVDASFSLIDGAGREKTLASVAGNSSESCQYDSTFSREQKKQFHACASEDNRQEAPFDAFVNALRRVDQAELVKALSLEKGAVAVGQIQPPF